MDDNKSKELLFLLGSCALLIFSTLFALRMESEPEVKTVSTPGYQTAKPEQVNLSTSTPAGSTSSEVLSSHARSPQIYVSGSKEGYASGGMISLSSTDEPAVEITSYNISGSARVDLYEASEGLLLDYLTHNKEGKQSKPTVDTSTLQFVMSVDHWVSSNYDDVSRLSLPLKETGIWVLRINLGSLNEYAFIVRSNIGTVVKEGDSEYIIWAQNFKTKRSQEEGSIRLYNLENGVEELGSVSLGSDGIATYPLTSAADIAIVQNGDDRTVVPINLKYLNLGYEAYKPFLPKTPQAKYFIFTDRPIYKPGDTVYFKSILRNDDDARYTIPTGRALAKIYTDEKNPLYEKYLPVSREGTIDGEFTLPVEAKTGYYAVEVSLTGAQYEYSNTSSFNVEYYRKPEYSLDIKAEKNEYISRDRGKVKIVGNYFSGQPISNQEVKYSIYSSDFYEYQYLDDLEYRLNDDYRYGYWYGDQLMSGTVTFDKRGEATIEFETNIAEKSKSQVFAIETEFDDGSGSPAFARKNVLVYAGEFGIYRTDDYSSAEVGKKVTIPFILQPSKDGKIAGVSVQGEIEREYWITSQEEGQKYPLYTKKTDKIGSLQTRSNSEGKFNIDFVPEDTGLYLTHVLVKDSRGNNISKTFYTWVRQQGEYAFFGEYSSGLTIQADRQVHQPGSTVKLSISSSIPDRDLLLSFDRARVNRYQVIKLEGKTQDISLPIVETDMPNIYAQVASFSTYTLDTSQVNLVVSTESKKLQVTVRPDKEKYGPGDTVNLEVKTTDTKGNPVSVDTAVWAVDKAIFELVSERPDDIFETFWRERYNDTQLAHSLEGITVLTSERGGCFASGTKILMADGSLRNIEEVKVEDYVLTYSDASGEKVKAKVLSTHEELAGGYLIINGNLKVTPNHRLFVNNLWNEASYIEIGDVLYSTEGIQKVKTIEWQAGNYKVYNLEVEKYHTYLANGVWVHNQKGGLERSIFKDTAYWNPSVRTDLNGLAKVNFKLPDNLTTWVISSIGATIDTKVGQTRAEVIATKDIIVRPILPNILRVGDHAVLSVLVQNFTDKDHEFDISLKFEGEKSRDFEGKVIKAGEIEQYWWEVRPDKVNEKTTFEFSALGKNDKKFGDIVKRELPVLPFGFYAKRVETGQQDKEFVIDLDDKADLERTKIKLTLAPSILTSLVASMEYLLAYPYGCVEQTISRLIPALIARENPELFGEMLKNKDLDAIINKGLARLVSLQKYDGGWTWWYAGNSDIFVTSYVFEYLIKAQSFGYKVDENMLTQAKIFLEQDKLYDLNGSRSLTSEEDAFRTYALSQSDSPRGKTVFSNLSSLPGLSPDVLSLAIIVNINNGLTDPFKNGVTELIAQSTKLGDSTFWRAGTPTRFGSDDASTALAIRALLAAGNQDDLVKSGVRFLANNRKFDYWSNTFATAQVIRTISEFTTFADELEPNYSYKVLLDKDVISEGRVIDHRKIIEGIEIPAKSIRDKSSKLIVQKQGDGNLYSTLKVEEFIASKNSKAENHGLIVTREYKNEKGEEYDFGVGDLVEVNLTIDGLETGNQYAVIEDELPAGFIPVNTRLENERYGNSDPYNDPSYGYFDREYTQNGAVLSLYEVPAGESTYTYKARVVAEGEFYAPPARGELMYLPEVWGRSDSEIINVKRTSELSFAKKTVGLLKGLFRYAPFVIAALVLILGIIGLAVYAFRTLKKKNHPHDTLD